MKRLMENTVFLGLVIACRLATCPTRRSPSFVNATTEGVVRPPSELGMTIGSPPSITATTELVVPKSIPITFSLAIGPFLAAEVLDAHNEQGVANASRIPWECAKLAGTADHSFCVICCNAIT